MGSTGPLMTNRVEFATIFPSGKYNRTKAINQGSNFYSINPYWAATVFVGPRATVSWRMHYLWNSKNKSPNLGLYGAAGDIQVGQAFHGNFTAAFAVIPDRLRLGLNGYFLKGITDLEVDGDGVSDSRDSVVAVGPGGVFHLTPKDTFFVNVYFEMNAENRTEGTRTVLRYVHQF
jgi:anthranilate 1,2-dioxygenase (deaminating, decarboxylating) large subunit